MAALFEKENMDDDIEWDMDSVGASPPPWPPVHALRTPSAHARITPTAHPHPPTLPSHPLAPLPLCSRSSRWSR